MHEKLAAANVVKHKVDLLDALERELERDEEGIGVGRQNLALADGVLDF